MTEEVGQLNASGEISRILVQKHLDSILQHQAENQSLEAEVLRLRGIEVCLAGRERIMTTTTTNTSLRSV